MDRASKARSLKHVLPRLFELLAAEVLTPTTAADARLSLCLEDVADELSELEAWPAPEQAAIRAFFIALLAAAPSPPDHRLAPFARFVCPVPLIMPA